MVHFKVTDWDNAYTNGAHIAGGDRWPAAWIEAARSFREAFTAAGKAKLDLTYGPAQRDRFDLFLPADRPKGLVVFIHGGYWLQFDKSYWSNLAAGPVANGYAVAMPSYTLCPELRIGGIVREVAAAIQEAASMIDGPLMLTGHSAGGHLVSRMITTTSPLPEQIRARIRHVVSISGVHDLRPLLRVAMNERLRIDAEEAMAESPALLQPMENARITCWAGSAERAEFVRQNALLANIWTGLGASTAAILEPDRHHFSVVEGLTDPSHPLTRTLLSE